MIDIVAEMVGLLTVHDREEKRLIHMVRRGGFLKSTEWEYHDYLERKILYTMARATDDQIREAIDRYDAMEEPLV